MIRRFFLKAAKLFWFLPAFLLWASYPPICEKTDVFFALAPLIWFARNKSPRESFKLWFLNGFIFWVATLAWMPAIVKNGGPWLLVILGWSVLASYCALYFGAFGYLSSRVWRMTGNSYWKRLLAILIAEPILWAGLELARSRLMGGFSWNQLGVAAVNAGFGDAVTLGGVYLVSAMVILLNGTLASIVERVLAPWLAARKRVVELGDETLELKTSDGASDDKSYGVPRWVRSIETVLPVLLIWGVHTWGSHYVRTVDPRECRPLTVALVQRNFPCAFKAADENPVEAYKKLLANVAPFAPDMVVLPESAFCELAEIDTPRALDAAGWLLKNSNAKSVIGGGSRQTKDALYNSAALYSRNSEGQVTEQIYDKVHLVPCGEYIPGDKLVPYLQKFAPVGSCTPGVPKLLEFDGLKFGVAICYEDTDSALIRRFAAMGADALVFITNDSWFSESDETVQHVWQAIARATETGLPVIRVGNSGVTGVVYPDGRSSWLTGKDGGLLIDQKGCKVERVFITPKSARSEPPYTVFGDMPLFVLFVLTLVFISLPAVAAWRLKLRNKDMS